MTSVKTENVTIVDDSSEAKNLVFVETPLQATYSGFDEDSVNTNEETDETSICKTTKELVTSSDDQSFSGRLYNNLLEKPELCDVKFLVGPNKEVVKYLKVILVSASKEFKKLFQEKWDLSVQKTGDEEGIPLPDVDPEAFKIFLKLLPCDQVRVETIFKMELSLDQLFCLGDICTTFGSDLIYRLIDREKKDIFESFETHLKEDKFLNLSQRNLKSVYSGDWIPVDEIKIFENALRWAKHHSTKMGLDATPTHLRSVLGEAYFEIRFPLMSKNDFCKTVLPTNILTVEEKSQLFEYFMGDDEIKNNLTDKMIFKSKKRCNFKEVHSARLFDNVSITSFPGFNCESEHQNWFSVDKIIAFVGVGFLGPVESDADYIVSVEISSDIGTNYCARFFCGITQKNVEAKKGEIFRVMFDRPCIVDPSEDVSIWYSIKGQRTQNLVFGKTEYNDCLTKFAITQHGVTFDCRWVSTQLVELLFSKI